MESYPEQNIILGFAEEPKKGDFNIQNFPSKLGGLPVFLFPPKFKNKANNIFKCQCGNCLTFLLQIYCPLEEKNEAYHRMIYVFFCNKCWKKKDYVKVYRVNLRSKSQYYEGDKMLWNFSELEQNEEFKKMNECLSKNILKKDYFISTDTENQEASKLYINFYSNLEENSPNSSNSDIIDNDDLDDIKVNKDDEEEYKNLTDKYIEQNPNVDINKVEKETEEEKENDMLLNLKNDNIMNLFSSVVEYDQKQILRYFRTSNLHPLWFTKMKMLTVKNIKCKNCGDEVIFEFQIMPYVFILYPEIGYNDIGTIVIYTCKNCCYPKNEGEFIEEYGFIQRTGENFRDLTDNDNKVNKNCKFGYYMDAEKIEEKVNDILTEDDKEFFGGKNENVDEDGFVEVKKKGKKKHKKYNLDDDEDEDKK